MKKRLLITAVACVLSMGLVACGGNNGGGGGNTPDPGPVEPEYEVTISNKEALQEPWKVGDAQRSVGIAPIKGVTIAEAIDQGLIKITSDHPEVVSVDGRLLSPVGVGTATITVTYKEKSDSVAIEVSQASLFKMIAEPEEGVDYYVGHKHYDGSGKMVFMRNSISSYYYLGFELEQENALYAQVKIDTSATDEYKYQISFTTTDEEGVQTTKFVGVANTAKGKFAAGIAGEKVESTSGEFTPKLANFKLDEEHRLVVKIIDTFDENKEYELVLGASDGYNTFGLGDATKILWPARFYVLSDEAIPATSMTVSPEELELAPGQVGKISYELEPVETTDSVTFETSDKAVATVDVAGNVTAVAEGTATIKVTANENVSKSVTVTVAGQQLNFGTKEKPLTVAEAKETLDKLGSGVVSPQPMYVEGVVYSAAWDSGYSNSEVWLKDAEGKKAFELFRTVGATDELGNIMDISKLDDGDTVRAYGYGKLHNGTIYELTTNASGNPANPTIYYIDAVEHPEIPEPTDAEYGSEESPLTPEQAKEFLDTYFPKGTTTPKDLYVTGEVSEVSTHTRPNIWLKSSDGEIAKYFESYNTTMADGVDKPAVGDTVVIKGKAKIYTSGENVTYELTNVGQTDYPVVLKVTPGEGGGGEEPPVDEHNYGSLEAPLSVADAIALLNEVVPTQGTWTSQDVYVTGKVSKVSYNSKYDSYTIDLYNGETADAFEIYSGKLAEGVDGNDIQVGATVCAYGPAKIHTTGMPEIAYNSSTQVSPSIYSVEFERPELTGIKFDVEGESIELIEGRTKAIKLLPLPEFAELPEEDPTWESSDPEVATISEGNNVGGLITAVSEGTAKITAKYSDEIKAEITVNVVKDSGEEPAYVDATMTKGTNAYDDVKVNGKPAIKVGKSSAGGDMTITVGAGATELVFYAAAWNGVTGLALNITGATANPTSVDLTADSAIAGTATDYAISDESQYKFVIALSDVTEETVIKLEGSIAKRFVVWGAQYK